MTGSQPAASGDRDRDLEGLLDQILARPDGQRPAALEEACHARDDLAAGLRQRVAMLARFGLIDTATKAAGLAPDTRFGPYRIVRELGTGGMGTVFLARQLEPFERDVALKLIRVDRPPDTDSRERFARESRALAGFDHQIFCTVYDAGVIDGRPYLAMRYVEGDTLAVRIDRVRREAAGDGAILAAADLTTDSGRLAPKARHHVAVLVALFGKIARGLAGLHEAGFLHRDLKPSNIVVDRRGEPVVLDFGLAKNLRESLVDLTVVGTPLGTPAYMAPEQVRGDAVIDASADVYGLGATLYECLALRPPFEQVDREALFHSILTVPPPELRRLNRNVSRDLSVVVAKTLEKEPRRRYASASDLADDLARVLVAAPVAARPAGPLRQFAAWRRQRPAVAHTLIALVVLLLVSLGFIDMLRRSLRETEAISWARESAVLLDKDQRAALDLAERAWQRDRSPATLSQLWNARAASCERARFDVSVHVGSCLWSPDGERLLCLTEQASFVLLASDGRVVHRAQLRPTKASSGPFEPLHSAAWTGDVFAVASREGVVSIRSGDDGTELAPPIAVEDGVIDRGLAFCEASGRIAIATRSGHVRVFDPRGQQLSAWRAHAPRSLSGVTWHAGSDQVVTTARDGYVRAWTVSGATAEQTREFEVGAVLASRWSDDGGHLGVGLTDGTVLILDFATGSHTPLEGLTGQVLAIAFAPDGDLVAAVDMDQRACVWKATGQRVADINARTVVFDVEFSRDGLWIAMAETGGRIRICDRNGHDVRILHGHSDHVADVVFAPNGALLASASWDGTVRIWEIFGRDFRVMAGHRNIVHAAHWLTGGRILSVGHDGELRLFDTATGRSVGVRASQTPLWGLGVSHDEKLCATGALDGSLRLWRLHPVGSLAEPEPLGPAIRAHDGGLMFVCFTPDGRLLTAATDVLRGVVRLWKLGPDSRPSGTPEELQVGAFDISMAAVDSSSSLLAVVSQLGQLDLFRMADRQRLWTRSFEGSAWSVEFTPDGKSLLVGHQDGTARTYDLDGRERSTKFQGHSAAIWIAKHSPDGKSVLTCSLDGTVKLWTTDGRLIATLDHGAPLACAGFSPDGAYLFAGGGDRLIRIWPTPLLGTR